MDDNGHGTVVAGIIAAALNRQGVAGLAPGAKVMAVKVLDADDIAALPNIVSVAALADPGNLASFSNYGASSVSLAAPGENINSTFPRATGDVGVALAVSDSVYGYRAMFRGFGAEDLLLTITCTTALSAPSTISWGLLRRKHETDRFSWSTTRVTAWDFLTQVSCTKASLQGLGMPRFFTLSKEAQTVRR